MRFTVHTGKSKTPFELQHGRKPRTKLRNLTNKQTSLLSKWESLCDLENPERLPLYITRDKNGNISDYLVMARKKKTEPQIQTSQSPTTRKTIRIPVNEKINSHIISSKKNIKRNHYKANTNLKYKKQYRKQNIPF